MFKRLIIIGVAAVAIAAAIGAILLSGSQEDVVAVRPDIPFAPLTDPSIKDADNPIKIFRVDFAKVEHDHPLTRADLMQLTPANLRTLNQEEIDQIYGRPDRSPTVRISAISSCPAATPVAAMWCRACRKCSAASKAGWRASRWTSWRMSAALCGKARCTIATSACCGTSSTISNRCATSSRIPKPL
jgi:hypothetical protein